ncbi:MAG: acylphosphatase [Pseudomonadota bacterium]|nr:acylphosphatase [Pseudomonadota bacterium]
MSAIGRCFRVSGRVQGVSYRAYCRSQARSLGIRGWARNMEDGSVWVAAWGDSSSVDQLADWLWRGSPASRVERVVEQARPEGPPPVDFSTG